MKTNFKKTLAVLLAVLMLTSVFSVTAFAAYTATIQAGSAEGSTLKATLENGTPITDDMLALTTNASNKVILPSEPYFEREDYIQDGWTKTAAGTGTLLKFGSTQTVRNNTTKFYPHWKQVMFTVTFTTGTYYNAEDVNNYTDETMTQIKEIFVKTDGTAAQRVTFPGPMYTREGYTQTGWSTSKNNNGTGTKFEFGSVYTKNITKNTSFYPYWTPAVYNVSFVGGEYGVGTSQQFEIEHNKTITAPGEIFTREGYTQIGWATVEGSEVVEVDLSKDTPKITSETTFYPVWRENIFDSSVQPESLNFGISCVDYSNIEAQEIIITNDGNMVLDFKMPETTNYTFEVVDGELSLIPGKSVTISIKPVGNLGAGIYKENVVFTCGYPQADVTVSVSFKVVAHSFGLYTSNGDATYSADGTKTAECLNGCGTKDVVEDTGSMKKYSADSNDAEGLSSSYIHHRTVRFTAYGSGMDAIDEKEVGKRFRPISWHVNDEFNGEFTGNSFENGYNVTFTHSVFGEYTLTINYVEEKYDETTGEWVATGVTDTKTFDYTVGTTAEEEQEIVRPNTILSIIFGLFQELLKLLGLGG